LASFFIKRQSLSLIYRAHIDEEIKGLNEGKKQAFAEAKGEGFDVKVLREILRLRKLDRGDREEHESLVESARQGAIPLRARNSLHRPNHAFSRDSADRREGDSLSVVRAVCTGPYSGHQTP
jgi:uncharacterized protein (UPF0335 family)